MTHTKRILAAVSCLVALAAGGCSSTPAPTSTSAPGGSVPQRGGTLNMLGTGDVSHLDPNVSYNGIDYQVERMFSRQLFTWPAVKGKQTTAVPDLATQIPTVANGGISKDAKTYTITMRTGVQWNTSPARDVTAADAVRGLKRTCNPALPFGGIPDFADLITGYQQFCAGFAKVSQTPAAMTAYLTSHQISGVSAPNDHTIVYHLNQPATYFVDMLSMPAFSPAPVEYDKYVPGSADQAQHTISDGPYQIDSYQPTKSITLSRNAAWDPKTDPVRKAYVDKIQINETFSQNSIQQQLEVGNANADMEFDVGPPPAALPALIASKDPNLFLSQTQNASSSPLIFFNTVSPNARGALSKLKVRQALEYGINRADIIQVMGGPTINPPLTHILPDAIVGSKPINLYPYDVSKAKQLLAQAGYPDGITVKIFYPSGNQGTAKVFQTLQQSLSEIGVTAKSVAAPSADFYKSLAEPSTATRGTWDLALVQWGADWSGNAAITYFNPMFSGKQSFPPTGDNFGQYNSAAANTLIHEAATATTLDQATKLWGEADEQVMKDAAVFPVAQPRHALYHASQVHNTVYIRLVQNFDPTNVWLSKDKQGG